MNQQIFASVDQTAGPPKIKSGWGGNMDFNKLSNELQSDLILFYSMRGCQHCDTANKALVNEINSGKVIVKDSSEAAKDGHKCSGYPCFVAHTGNKEGFTVGGQSTTRAPAEQRRFCNTHGISLDAEGSCEAARQYYGHPPQTVWPTPPGPGRCIANARGAAVASSLPIGPTLLGPGVCSYMPQESCNSPCSWVRGRCQPLYSNWGTSFSDLPWSAVCPNMPRESCEAPGGITGARRAHTTPPPGTYVPCSWVPLSPAEQAEAERLAAEQAEAEQHAFLTCGLGWYDDKGNSRWPPSNGCECPDGTVHTDHPSLPTTWHCADAAVVAAAARMRR
jgi:hypothetical protein